MVQSGVALDGTLNIDLSDYQGGADIHQLIEADALTGALDDIHIYGLDDTHNATLVVDYDTGQVNLDITEGGTGDVFFENFGDPNTGSGALWDALTANQGAYDDTEPTLHDEEGALLFA